MAQRLPSLNGLRAFEAAARHLSLTKAARELKARDTAFADLVARVEARLW